MITKEEIINFKKHYKISPDTNCLGVSTDCYNEIEWDCCYNTIIECEDCKYHNSEFKGRKNPNAKCNHYKG